MYLYNIKYLLSNPKGNKKSNTVSFPGRIKDHAIFRFRMTHPSEEILKIKRDGPLCIYTFRPYMKRWKNK